MITSINGLEAAWTRAIWRLWHTIAEEADPKLTTVPVTRANYFTPRPAVDEYNTGSRTYGFVYCVGRQVYQREFTTPAIGGANDPSWPRPDEMSNLNQLISDAAQAVEEIDPDELERYAKGGR